ncbi:MAG: [protein-PII] uridylyltransferase [candidate division NC10 bacterium]|nr:[protein-PII] uridylyltransferase [candidate division NC10 bacterium]
MPDPVGALTRLFRWGTPARDPAEGMSYGPETEVAIRFRTVLETQAPAAHGTEGEALRTALLPAVRDFISGERARIQVAHRGGASGLEVVARHADLVDAVVCQLFRLADRAVPRGLKARGEGCAVVALGGYGRRELNPGSDVDLMFLFPRRLDEYVTAMLNHILYFLWDLGFSVGHSCRSLGDALRMMDADLTARTSMLEARFLAGTPGVFEGFQDRMWRALQGRRAQQYIQRKIHEQAQRHGKYGGSVYLQEPNVKEGPGGLRDFHTALWVARARHRLEDLKALPALGLLTPVELAQCLQALDFLLRVRSELHYLHGGKSDVLSLSLQVPVAANLGFRDEATYGVERFMQQYYTRAGALHQFSARLIERCVARPGSQVEAVMRKLRARDIGDDFTELNRQIHILPGKRHCFQEDPIRLLKIFWYRLEMGYELGPEATGAVRSNLGLIDDEFRRSNRALGFFLAILKAPRGVAETLRQMHHLGVLSAYIPEFARVACLVQFDYYHRYTVDEHTFVLLDHLEALADTADPRLQEFRRIASELKKPEVLKLAILFHDIGKGEGHGHVERGVAIAGEALTRMGLAEGDIAGVNFLVAQHLSMAHIAERRDLDDERMLIDFARQVGDEDLLKMLYLLTYLDINAVGPQVWTDWKGTLLWELFIKTHTILTRGVPEGEEEHRKAASLRASLVAELGGEFGPEGVRQHLELMPTRYVLTTSSAKVAQHLQLIEQVRRGEPVAVRWAAYPLAGYSEVAVCAPGAPGRFAKVVGTLTANGINILSAQLFSRADGVMIRAFQVSDGRGAALEEETTWQRFARDLKGVVQDQADVRDLIKARRRDLLAKPAPRTGDIHTRIEFDNVVSDRYTVIDIRAQDRLGLLYMIASTLSDMDLDVALAKIATEVDQAMDVFYVTEKDGTKVPEGSRMEAIRETLVHAIAEGIA